MHELSIASSIVESVLEFAGKNEIAKVLVVKLSIGELMAVEWEQLRFCYAAITRETAMEDSSLEIELVEATVHCPYCSFRGRPKYWEDALSFGPIATLECPECGKAADPVQGKECAIKTIKYVAQVTAAEVPSESTRKV
jgi:hydrogenase nickel incorporation protein HypA/HybF